jgi:2-oxoglutarate ferredoxin oxidoreductase subunit beta
MVTVKELNTPATNTWCPGCGNFGLMLSFKQAVSQLELKPEKVVAVSGIGCHGKITDYVNVNALHVIHGRVLPAATALKLSNHDLTVVGFAGDGDAYNIGMGHFPHAARKNVDLTYITHNNLIYGLTTGQASPTSKQGMVTKTSPRGLFEVAINPLEQALAAGATFVSRVFAGDAKHSTEIMKQAIQHKGFALVDVLQPCVAWNKVNTYEFYRERVYKLGEEEYDVHDFEAACDKSLEWGDKIPIGVLYKEERDDYTKAFPMLEKSTLIKQELQSVDMEKLLGHHR